MKALGVLIIVTVLAFIAFKALQSYLFIKELPVKIEVAYPIAIGEEIGLREGCGVAVFKLSASSLELIRKHGLKFFDGITLSRGYYSETSHRGDRYTYQLWKETMTHTGWIDEEPWFACSVIDHDLVDRIVIAAQQAGAYYTTGNETQLLVLPSLGYAVFSYYGY